MKNFGGNEMFAVYKLELSKSLSIRGK
jgi:hypothetical protein